MSLYYSGSLYFESTNNIPQTGSDDITIEYFTGSLQYSTATGSNLDVYNLVEVMRYDPATSRFVLTNFGYDVVQRSNFKNSWPTALKNSNVVWIMRGKRQDNNDFITWRSPDNPSSTNAGTQIIEGTAKVIGYFYDET